MSRKEAHNRANGNIGHTPCKEDARSHPRQRRGCIEGKGLVPWKERTTVGCIQQSWMVQGVKQASTPKESLVQIWLRLHEGMNPEHGGGN